MSARRCGTIQNFKGEVNGMRPDERAHRFGMWMLNQLSHDLPARFQFTRAMEFCKDHGIVGKLTTTDGNGAQNLIP